MKRFGYFLSKKKQERFKLHELNKECRELGIELCEIDLSEPLEDQGPFDVIMHNVNNLINKAEQGILKAEAHLKAFEDYVERHPEVRVINPLSSVYKLSDRKQQYSFVQQCLDRITDCSLYVPSFVEFTSKDVDQNLELMRRNHVTFPLVCKPTNSSCHQMQLVFDEESLANIHPPCLVQTFINHNAILYKVMVIDTSVFVVERPSIRNFDTSKRPSLHFDSQSVSKVHSSGYLNENEEIYGEIIAPVLDVLKDMGYQLKEQSGLDIIGIDVIVEAFSGKYYVIDVNPFPGFEGIQDEFRESLKGLLNKCPNNSNAKS